MWDGHGQIGIGMKVSFKSIFSNHCNVVGHDDLLDVELGRNEIMRGSWKK
jgi:hypothetical protein